MGSIRDPFRKESESNDFTVIDSNASIDDQQPFALDKRVRNSNWNEGIDNPANS